MSKSTLKSSGPSKTKPSGPAIREVKPSGASRAIRETVESIVIAFVLAFLFRTFEAEAFVIPTGSMAPTLQGRHKALNCPKCGYRYRVSASGEVDRDSNRRSPRDFYDHQVVSTTCPMCRYPDDAAAEETSYNGDRILVAKFAYDYREPERWDVIVFKFPGDAQTNYIKRLVGLPGETIRIEGGDLYARKAGEADFTICRKSPTKLQAMLQEVFDNDYLLPELLENGWLPRWNSIGLGKLDVGDWKTTDNKLFVTDGSAARDVWLRYAHSMPTRSDWEAMKEHRIIPNSALSKEPQLITDFYAYNAGRARNAPRGSSGVHWVGDLAVDCELTVRSDSGEALLDLVEGGVHFQCRIDVATGEAKLRIDGRDDFTPTGKTPIDHPGVYQLSYANVDDQLTLWVNGDVIPFDQPTTYDHLGLNNRIPQSTLDKPGDLFPAGVGSHGADLSVNHLKLRRDIYYIAVKSPSRNLNEYAGKNVGNIYVALHTPSTWETLMGNPPSVDFSLEQDQFFVLGDNSPQSQDGRLWGNEYTEYYVARDLLIGKALFIYWPHTNHRITGTSIPFPFFPNFPRMGFVR